MDTARKIGKRYLRENKGSEDWSLSDWIDWTISRSSVSGSSEPIKWSTARASSTRFCVASQRELGGIPKSIIRKRSEGRAATPNSQRHSLGPSPILEMQ